MNKEQLIQVAMVAIQCDGYGVMVGGHLVFAGMMEEKFKIPVKDSIEAYNEAKLLTACGQQASMIVK